MISTIDRKRIFIFVAITYAITIAAALGIFLVGGTGSGLAPETTLAGLSRMHHDVWVGFVNDQCSMSNVR